LPTNINFLVKCRISKNSYFINNKPIFLKLGIFNNFNTVFPVVVLVFDFEEFSEEVLHGHSIPIQFNWSWIFIELKLNFVIENCYKRLAIGNSVYPSFPLKHIIRKIRKQYITLFHLTAKIACDYVEQYLISACKFTQRQLSHYYSLKQ
jgi:hypothetical protein